MMTSATIAAKAVAAGPPNMAGAETQNALEAKCAVPTASDMAVRKAVAAWFRAMAATAR